LFVLLVLQLLSASAQPVSAAVVFQNTTHAPAPDPVALLQCEAHLQEAVVQSSNNATAVETKQVQTEDFNSRLQKYASTSKMSFSEIEILCENICWSDKFIKKLESQNNQFQQELNKCMRDFVNQEFVLGSTNLEIGFLNDKLAEAEKIIKTLNDASQQAAPAETCKDENLEAELANARKHIAELDNAKSLMADQVAKLTEELEKARHNITQLKNASSELTEELEKARHNITELKNASSELTKELEKARHNITELKNASSENSTFPDITMIVSEITSELTFKLFLLVILLMCIIHEFQRWWVPRQLTYIKSDFVRKNIFCLWKTQNERLARKYAFIWRRQNENLSSLAFRQWKRVLKRNWKLLCFYFCEWKQLRKKDARLLDCTSACFQTLMSTFYTEHIQRAQRANDLLESMWQYYNLNGTIPVIRPQNKESIEDLVYKQVEHISKQIGYAYCQFNPMSAQFLLEYLPNMKQVLRVQTWCRNFLNMKRYVTKFRLFLHSEDAQALSLYKFGSLYKFARQANGIQNEDTTSLPARLRKAKVLKSYAPTMHSLFDTIYVKSNIIWKELEKRRDAREYHRNLSSNFWKLLKYCKRLVAVVLGAVVLAIVVLGLSIGICLALYEFYGVREVCGVNDDLKYS